MLYALQTIQNALWGFPLAAFFPGLSGAKRRQQGRNTAEGVCSHSDSYKVDFPSVEIRKRGLREVKRLLNITQLVRDKARILISGACLQSQSSSSARWYVNISHMSTGCCGKASALQLSQPHGVKEGNLQPCSGLIMGIVSGCQCFFCFFVVVVIFSEFYVSGTLHCTS